MIAFLNLTENKLKRWTSKFGDEEDVQILLDQYHDYVIKNDIIQEFNKAFDDMRNVVTEYKKDGNIGKSFLFSGFLENVSF